MTQKVIPIEQGLKHQRGRGPEGLEMTQKVIPIEQGLKHSIAPQTSKTLKYSEGHSNRTRIETVYELARFFHGTSTQKVIPIEQGLKHFDLG